MEPEKQQLGIIVDASSFRKTASGTVVGVVYVSLGDVCFPAPDWDDFAVAVVTAFLSCVFSVLQSAGHTERAYFMDGPYCVDFERRDGRLSVAFIESTRDDDVVRHKSEVSPGHVLLEVLSVAERVLAECRRRGWEDDDTEALGRLYDEAIG